MQPEAMPPEIWPQPPHLITRSQRLTHKWDKVFAYGTGPTHCKVLFAHLFSQCSEAQEYVCHIRVQLYSEEPP